MTVPRSRPSKALVHSRGCRSVRRACPALVPHGPPSRQNLTNLSTLPVTPTCIDVQFGGGSGSLRTSRPVSRILCPSAKGGRRPSIWAHRHRVPQAVHPRTRASSPSVHYCTSSAQPHRRAVRPSTLLRAGFTQPPQSPGVLVRSYRTVSPLPRSKAWRSVFCGTYPAGHPGLPLATTLLCGVRTFLGKRACHQSAMVPVPRPSGRLVRPPV